VFDASLTVGAVGGARQRKRQCARCCKASMADYYAHTAQTAESPSFPVHVKKQMQFINTCMRVCLQLHCKMDFRVFSTNSKCRANRKICI
jgi:hypothetical protein